MTSLRAAEHRASTALRETVLPTYTRADLTIVRGDGCRVWDDNGREYLDFVAGIAVVGLGHGAQAPLAAAREQLDRLWHASNLYWTEPMLRLAGLLAGRFEGGRAFFCNSGAEANEAALKIARKATGRTRIVALEGGFHGRTFGALAATGQPSKWEGFGPLVPGVSFARPNDVESLEAALAPARDTAVLLLEPVLGEGGVIPLEPSFAQAAAELALEIGALLCVDEVQTGMGRTGTFFAFEQLGIRPDLVTLAKGLANGLPMGALLAGERAASGFVPGDHGSTFGGNPVVAAAARPPWNPSTRICSRTWSSAARNSQQASRASPRFARCGDGACSSAPSSTVPSALSSMPVATKGCWSSRPARMSCA